MITTAAIMIDRRSNNSMKSAKIVPTGNSMKSAKIVPTAVVIQTPPPVDEQQSPQLSPMNDDDDEYERMVAEEKKSPHDATLMIHPHDDDDHHDDHHHDDDHVFPLSSPETSNNKSYHIEIARKTPSNESRSSSIDDHSSLHAKEIRENLMRTLVDRDPLFYYEVVCVLGVGSMGSVARVRKRDEVVGGSARRQLQAAFEKERRVKRCLSMPILGGLFRFCIQADGVASKELKKYNNSNRSISGGSSHHSNNGEQQTTANQYNLFAPKPNLLQDHQEIMEMEEDNGSGTSYEATYAMKSIHLNRVTDPGFIQELKNEVSILKTLDHPHIVRAIETFEHRNQIFIVMELCSGGDLYSRDPYTEQEAARIVNCILGAISYMHSKNVVHRDLKYENILFVNDSPKAEVKLIDFGLSKKYLGDENQRMTDGVGTLYSMSPEVLRGNYTKQADLWSIGVLAFMLLSSQMPFYGRKRRHIVEQIMKCKYDFKGRRWKRISKQAKAFVKDLLVLDPDERATSEEAMCATWLNCRYTATVRDANHEEQETAKRSIMKYVGYSKLKKVALMVVAHKSTSQEIGILRKLFQKYDKRQTGQIRFDEFKEALSASGYSEQELQSIFKAVDLDGSGFIRYTEFLAATIEARGAICEERLAEAFDRLDSDDSGYISPENLKEILGPDFPQEEIDEIIAEVDFNQDNRISYPEFLALWENKNEELRDQALRQHEKNQPITVSSFSYLDDSDDVASQESDDILSRANFLGGKMSSERRVEPLVAAPADTKKVCFAAVQEGPFQKQTADV